MVMWINAVETDEFISAAAITSIRCGDKNIMIDTVDGETHFAPVNQPKKAVKCLVRDLINSEDKVLIIDRGYGHELVE